MYVIRDSGGYLVGYGQGHVDVAPIAGAQVVEVDMAPEAYQALVQGLPGWGGDWRFVQVGADGQPTAYTPRALTSEEQAQDEKALGKLSADELLTAIDDRQAELQGYLDVWDTLTTTQVKAVVRTLVVTQRQELQVWKHVIKYLL